MWAVGMWARALALLWTLPRASLALARRRKELPLLLLAFVVAALRIVGVQVRLFGVKVVVHHSVELVPAEFPGRVGGGTTSRYTEVVSTPRAKEPQVLKAAKWQQLGWY